MNSYEFLSAKRRNVCVSILFSVLSLFVRFERIFRTPYTLPIHATYHARECTSYTLEFEQLTRIKMHEKKQQQRAHRLQYTVRIITIICDGQVDSTRFRDGFVFSLYTSISRLFRRLTICYRVCAVFNATLDAIVCLARAPAKRFRQMHLQDQFNKR